METSKILENKTYLYLTEFFAGMAVMAAELGASRLLAPYFSSSQIVWTIIIGTIMISLALGHVYGGRKADKDPNPDRIYRRILFASVWLAAIPLLGKFIIVGISGALVLTVSSGFLVLASLLSCLILFVYPLFLLGTVTPALVKITASSLEDTGRTVGNLGAFNTIGSILGTFLPTFVTIPTVGTAVTFLLFSGVLLLLGMIYFFSVKRRIGQTVVALILFVLFSLFGCTSRFAFWEESLAYEGESIYNYLQVKETDNRVILSTNVLFGVQSVAMKDGGMTGMYYDYALVSTLMTGMPQDPEKDVLILGMGSGTFATLCQEIYPQSRIDGVEIDAKITNLARTYFSMPEEVHVTTYDGRAYLAAEPKQYDLILVDAYQDITIPFQMSTVEFFTLVREHLKEGGILVVNMNLHAGEEGSINQYLSDTVESVFPDSVYVCNVPGSSNRELFAGKGVDPMEALKAHLSDPVMDPGLLRSAQYVWENLFFYGGGDYLLTDDRAPVEVLGMDAIDAMIQEEVGRYKEILDEEGFSGLLDAIG